MKKLVYFILLLISFNGFGQTVLTNNNHVTVTNKTMSGASNTFTNIPFSTGITGFQTLTISSPLTGTSFDGSAPISIGIANAAADATTKGAATFTAADFNATTGLISIDYTNGQAASASLKGFLTSTDWSTFNSKESALTFSTGLTRTTNTITNNLSTGISGGQNVYGGTSTGESITVRANAANTTTGFVYIGNTVMFYDIANNTFNVESTLNVGKQASNSTIDVFNNDNATGTSSVRFLQNNGTEIGRVRSFNPGSATTWAGIAQASAMQLLSFDKITLASVGDIYISPNNTTPVITAKTTGKVGLNGITNPSAWLNLPAGSATASTAPLKFTAGTNLTTTEAGAIEFDGTHLYFTASNAGTRYQLDQQGGGTTIYSGDGSLAGDRTVDLDGHKLEFEVENDDYFLKLDPTTDNESALLQAINFTNGETHSNRGSFTGYSDNTLGGFELNAQFDQGDKFVDIQGEASTDGSFIEYTADTHTFNGDVGVGRTPTAFFDVFDPVLSQSLILADITNFQTALNASDGTASSVIRVNGNGGTNTVLFDIAADDGVSSSVEIFGDAIAQTITLTSATTNISNLAGTGTRAVLASATGDLSAPISDIRLKENIFNITDSIDVIRLLKDDSKRGIYFNWRNPKMGTEKELGFTAQSFDDVKGMTGTMTNTGYKYLNYDRMPVILWEQNRLLLQRIEVLEKEVKELKK